MKKRILFIDDDPNILSGMKRLTRGLSDEFDITFCDSPDEAAALIGSEGFDAVVTDFRMPGMSGIELLSLVKRTHPEAVRILLTGQTEGEVFEQSKGVVHKYLSKPCPNQEIIDSIREQLSAKGAGR